MNRRDFVKSSTLAAVTGVTAGAVRAEVHGGKPPVVIASANGLRATARAMEMIQRGEDTLDAVVAGVNLVEEDPEDMSVGYGGLAQ
jgi:N4-(beta-N-acetylglucosaminyl)-L-asparaginase